MTVLEVLETASLYLNLRSELDYYFNEDNSTLPSTELQNKFNTMLNALNLVVKEIATEFKPIYLEENVTFVGGEFSVNSLSKTANKIICVGDNLTQNKFCVLNGNIKIDCSGEKTVKYSFVPEDLTTSDDVDFFEGINKKTLAFGVLMEYFFLLDIIDEALIWEEKFYKSLKNSLRDFGKFKLPARRWI